VAQHTPHNLPLRRIRLRRDLPKPAAPWIHKLARGRTRWSPLRPRSQPPTPPRTAVAVENLPPGALVTYKSTSREGIPCAHACEFIALRPKLPKQANHLGRFMLVRLRNQSNSKTSILSAGVGLRYGVVDFSLFQHGSKFRC